MDYPINGLKVAYVQVKEPVRDGFGRELAAVLAGTLLRLALGLDALRQDATLVEVPEVRVFGIIRTLVNPGNSGWHLLLGVGCY